MSWTPERVARLKELAALPDKLSAAQIGDRLGVTRNAVIGACRRYSAALQIQRYVGRKPKDRPIALPFAKVAKAKSFKRNISLINLRDGMCRYPTTDGSPYLFCGDNQIEDSSYCLTHHKICHYQTARQVAA